MKINMKLLEIKENKQALSIDIDRADFALTLKTWRLRAGKTQQEVADMFGCSRYTIIRAEKAKDINWAMAYRLFSALSKELRKEVE